jgi:heparinase II/III-like protein
LFDRSDFKAIKPDLVEETVWLLGSGRALKFNAMPISPSPVESVALRSSGLYLMMSPSKPQARLTIDAGPHGSDGGGHGHADALSIQLTFEGREVLVDPGTFVYASAGSERQMFRGTASHNTIQVDGFDQAEPGGPFPWRRLPEVRVENWTEGSSFDLLVASHRGYTRLADPVVHRRSVFGLKSQFWLVLDSPEGRGNHHADMFWHLASDLQWELRENSALATWKSGAVALLFAETQGWWPRIQQGWHSPVYGSRKESEVLVFHREGELQASFATLLLPLADSAQNIGLLTRIHQESADSRLRAFRYDRWPESHFFFSSPDRPWRWRELSSDAEFLYYSISQSGRKRLIVCGATYVAVVGEPAISCSRALSRLEWAAENAHLFFSCSDESAIQSTSWEHLTSLERWAAEMATV